MKQSKIIYETGATSHAVNDLILFTDSTRELVDSRDIIYNQLVAGNTPPQSYHFKSLLTLAINSYIHTFPTSHWETTLLSEAQKHEFCQLYANEFNIWKSENGYK